MSRLFLSALFGVTLASSLGFVLPAFGQGWTNVGPGCYPQLLPGPDNQCGVGGGEGQLSLGNDEFNFRNILETGDLWRINKDGSSNLSGFYSPNSVNLILQTGGELKSNQNQQFRRFKLDKTATLVFFQKLLELEKLTAEQKNNYRREGEIIINNQELRERTSRSFF